MRKLSLLFFLSVILSCTNIFAGNAFLFSYDQEKLNTEMVSLEALENYLASHPETEKSTLALKTNLDLNTQMLNPSGLAFGFEDVEWGSFAWGFCCWPVGIFTVILNDEKDKNHKISYFAGIITSAIIGVIGRVVYTAMYVASTV